MTKLYTTAEVGELLGHPPISIRKAAARLGVGQRIGRDWVFTENDVVRLRVIRTRKRKPRECKDDRDEEQAADDPLPGGGAQTTARPAVGQRA